MNKLDVLYEDNHVIVVKKPVNVLSQSDKTEDIDMLSMVKQYVKEKYNKPGNVYIGLVHRLDRPVGGIMVFARTSKAASRLSKQVADHTLRKTYLAITSSVLSKKSDEWVDYIAKKSNGNSFVTDKEHGKIAKLSYEVIASNNQHSLVKINLETGRHHQIRVQFSSRGYALCGDQRYGKEDRTQIALWAYKLSFIHPTTKEVLEFECLPPEQGWWTEFTLSKNVNIN